MRKIGVWILVAGTTIWSLVKALWSLLNAIGSYDEAQRLFENRGSLLKGLVQTSSFWPFLLLALGLFLLACIQFGSPRNWIRTREEKKREQGVYEKTISDYAKQEGFAINAFYKSGGFELPVRSIRVLLKRLAQIKIEVFPDETIAPSEQTKFINRLKETGRALETPEEANDAWVEWRESKTLRAPWEPFPEPTGFPAIPRRQPEIPKKPGHPHFVVFEPKFEHSEVANKYWFSIGYKNVGEREAVGMSARFLLWEHSLQFEPMTGGFEPANNAEPNAPRYLSITIGITRQKIEPHFVVLMLSYHDQSQPLALKQFFFYKWSGIKDRISNFSLSSATQQERILIEQRLQEKYRPIDELADGEPLIT